MKKKLSVALFSSLMFIGLSFSSLAGAISPAMHDPGGGGGAKPPPCVVKPCPIPT